MTVATTTNKTSEFVAGVSSLPFTFPVFNQDDLDVILVNSTTLVETKLTRGTDYSVSLLYDGAGGGTVTLVSAIPSGSTGYVKRVLDTTQEIDLKNQGDWFPEQHEEAFDRSVMLSQQLQEQVDRTLKTNNSGTKYNAGNLPIQNLGNGVDSQDAVTMSQLSTASTNAIAAAYAQAQAYVNAVISNFITNSTINGLVYETTVAAGQTVISTPYTFTGGFMNIGGVFYNLKNSADITLSAGSPTTITLSVPVAVDSNVIMFLI